MHINVQMNNTKPNTPKPHLKIDGSIPKSEAYVSDPTLNRFAGGGGSGGGDATGKVEEHSEVLWLNQGADRFLLEQNICLSFLTIPYSNPPPPPTYINVYRYCIQEEGASLSYSQPRSERSAYCEFEYYFRTDIATALNVTTSRVLMLLIKSASRY
jgi:hypothetical protein